MLANVRKRLLHNAVGRQVDHGRYGCLLAPDRQCDGKFRIGVHQRFKIRKTWLRCIFRCRICRAQHAEQAAKFVEGLPSRGLDGGERLDGEIGLGVNNATGTAGLNGHHADGVSDDVVELTGDAAAFGDDRAISEQTLLALKERVAVLQIDQSLATLSHVVARRKAVPRTTTLLTSEPTKFPVVRTPRSNRVKNVTTASTLPAIHAKRRRASVVTATVYAAMMGGKRVATRRVVQSLPQDKHGERDDEYRERLHASPGQRQGANRDEADPEHIGAAGNAKSRRCVVRGVGRYDGDSKDSDDYSEEGIGNAGMAAEPQDRVRTGRHTEPTVATAGVVSVHRHAEWPSSNEMVSFRA